MRSTFSGFKQRHLIFGRSLTSLVLIDTRRSPVAPSTFLYDLRVSVCRYQLSFGNSVLNLI
ncbi:MAG: hypothetical protein ACK491_05820 [Pseudanabaena sp.]